MAFISLAHVSCANIDAAEYRHSSFDRSNSAWDEFLSMMIGFDFRYHACFPVQDMVSPAIWQSPPRASPQIAAELADIT
eukprot:6181906-Pleurochrysis_carterae.AAC.1